LALIKAFSAFKIQIVNTNHQFNILHGSYSGAQGRMSPYDLTLAAKKQRNSLVIFAHGFKGFKDWGPWQLVAQTFAEKGFDFLKFNFSHNGGTLDDPIDFPDLAAFAENTYSKEVYDLNKVLSMVEQGIKGPEGIMQWDRLLLIGHSRGGGIAVLCAGRPSVAALVTWAAVADFGERFNFDLEKWRHDGVAYVKNGRTGQDMPHHFDFYKDYEENAGRLNILSAAAQLKCRSLVVHSRDDEAVAFADAKRLTTAMHGSTSLFLNGGGHTFGGGHPWRKKTLPESLKVIVDFTADYLLENK
jgi:pimeloyl-ACP methyl ester carboxylesterase